MSTSQAHSLDSLATTFAFHTVALEKVAGQLEGDDWLVRLGEASHAYWIIGHLAYCRRAMLRATGVDVESAAWEEPFRRGSKPGDDMNAAPINDLLTDLRSVGEQIVQQMRGLPAEARAAESGRTFPTGESSVEGLLYFMSFHEAYHIGQVSMIARSLGRPGLA